MKKEVRSRFAPSPTGFLHIGNLRTALYGYLYAKKNNGKFIVRIEDTDTGRYVDGAVDVILDTLHEAGIVFDEGPNIGGPYAPYIQSQRKNEYMRYAKELVEKGGAYHCFCTKERLAGLEKNGEARTYDRHCRNLTKEQVEENLKKGVPYVIRQKMPTEGRTEYHDLVFGDISLENKELEDQILVKSDGMPTYNFANVIDDHNMDITVVMRGCEYISSTPKYCLLYRAFGWDEPVYIHLGQIMKDATHKLSKRDGDASFFDFVNHGYLKEAVINYIALLGWAPKNNQEKMTMAEMEQLFDVDGISKSQSIFDEAKLKWLNGLYLKELSEEDFFVKAVKWFENSPVKEKYNLKKLCRLAQSRVDTLADVPALWNFLEEFGFFDNQLYTNQKLKTSPETAKEVLPYVKESLVSLTSWNEESIHQALLDTVQKLGVKNGIVLWPARVALSGRASTPGGATELADILGRDETLRRLDFAIQQLEK